MDEKKKPCCEQMHDLTLIHEVASAMDNPDPVGYRMEDAQFVCPECKTTGKVDLTEYLNALRIFNRDVEQFCAKIKPLDLATIKKLNPRMS